MFKKRSASSRRVQVVVKLALAKVQALDVAMDIAVADPLLALTGRGRLQTFQPDDDSSTGSSMPERTVAVT